MEKEAKRILKPEEISKKIMSKSSKEFFWFALPENLVERFFSESILNVTGFSEDEINSFPNKYFSLIHTDDQEKFKKYINSLLTSDEEKSNIVYRIIEKEERVIWISEDYFIEKNKRGLIRNIFGKASDITESMDSAEKFRKREQELVELNAAKDKFISIISHDLKSPFTSILGFVDILMNEKNISETDKQEYLKYIHNSSSHQLQLVNHLSDWCKIKNGRIKFDRRKLSLQTVLHNSIFNLTGEAVRKNIKIKTEVKGSFSINADEKLISDAISHILGNSIKFSNENQTVEVTAGIFNNDFLEIVIKDEGVGISEANQEKLFKIDSVFSTDGTKGEKGTGLGLALAKEIINKHNGEIWFYSTKGKGTEFHFTIPHVKDYILIINDDPMQRDFIKDIITTEFPFYGTSITGNNFDALNIIEEKIPSLIITSNDAPLVNGINMIEMIRKVSRTETLPLLLINESLTDKSKYEEIINVYEIFPPLNKKNLIRQLKLALNL